MVKNLIFEKGECYHDIRRINYPTYDLRRSFEELERMRTQMDRLFGQPTESIFSRPAAGVFPLINLTENKENYYIRAELPGVEAKNLNVDLRDNTLTLTGMIEPVEVPDEEDIPVEYEVGTYYRQFALSEVIDQSKIDAQLNDGVLRLHLPKVEKATPRQITVKAG